jgi:hypothetical protein
LLVWSPWNSLIIRSNSSSFFNFTLLYCIMHFTLYVSITCCFLPLNSMKCSARTMWKLAKSSTAIRKWFHCYQFSLLTSQCFLIIEPKRKIARYFFSSKNFFNQLFAKHLRRNSMKQLNRDSRWWWKVVQFSV